MHAIKQQPTIPRNSSLPMILLISAGVHLVLLLLLNRPVPLPASVTKEVAPQPIQARLVFMPPPSDPEPAIVSEMPVAAEQAPPQAEVAEIPPAEDPLQGEKSLVNKGESATTLTAPDKPVVNSKKALSNYMRRHQAERQSQAAQQAAGTHAQQQLPQISGLPVKPRLTPEQSLMKSITTSVDCSTGLNKTLATIAAFTGGMVKCTDTPAIDSYIDRHLHKLPADQKAVTRPLQPVVVKQQ